MEVLIMDTHKSHQVQQKLEQVTIQVVKQEKVVEFVNQVILTTVAQVKVVQ